MSFRLQLLFPLGHWALIVFLLLFQLAHRPSCLQASARLRPWCRRSQTVRRPLALASAPRTVARDAGAVDPAVVASVGCEECLRRLRSLQLARRTTTACLPSPSPPPLETDRQWLGAPFFVIPLLAYCSVITCNFFIGLTHSYLLPIGSAGWSRNVELFQ